MQQDQKHEGASLIGAIPSVHLTKITEEVAILGTINNSGLVIENAVSVEKERIEKRIVEIGMGAIDAITILTAQVDGLRKPDINNHMDMGQGVYAPHKGFSEKRFQELKSASEKLKNLNETFDTVSSVGTIAEYERLAKLLEKLNIKKQQ